MRTFGALLAFLLTLLMVPVAVLLASPAAAETIQVPISGEPVFGDPGSVVQLGSVQIDAGLQGRSCSVEIIIENQASENPGNTLIVSSGGSQLVVNGIDDVANSRVRSTGTLVLGTSIDVSVVLGSAASSTAMSVSCWTSPVVTVRPTTETTRPDKSHIPVSCSPEGVPVGGELTVSGGRKDGFGYKPGEELQVRVDGEEVARTTVQENGLFSVVFTVELPPGTYVFEAFSLGAAGEASCTVVEVPAIAVSPTSGLAGSPATVSGSGYESGDVIDVSFGELVFATDVAVDENGEFSVTAEVPALIARSYPVSAKRERDPEAASVDFLITMEPGTPVISISPASGAAGSPVTVSGSGYDPGDVVDISFDGVEFASDVAVDGDGEFSVPGEVPPLDAGPHPVSADRGRDPEAANVDFTISRIVETPTIRVSPEAGKVGSSATVSGSNYQPGDIVDINFGGSPFVSDVVVGDAGEFLAVGSVPDLEAGPTLVSARRGNRPEAADVNFAVTEENGCTKWFGICWWWWLLILLLLLLLLWLAWLLMCRLRYPFHPGEPIRGSGWIAEKGDCRSRQGVAVPGRAGSCDGDGCSCQMFRRKIFGSEGCWERVPSRQERFTYCYRTACAREEAATQGSS